MVYLLYYTIYLFLKVRSKFYITIRERFIKLDFLSILQKKYLIEIDK